MPTHKQRYPVSMHQKLVGIKNRERIRHWFTTHVGSTNVECAQALSLNVCVVGRHIKAIRKEWLAKMNNGGENG